MTLLSYKALFALLIFVISVLTVIYPLRKQSLLEHAESLELGEALASGIFLGAAFFHMLPDAINMFQQSSFKTHFPIAEAICVFGFLFLLFLERVSLAPSAIQFKNSTPYILVAILIVHALIEGAALGVGRTYSETIMLLIAILAHKGSESFALCVSLLKHQFPFKQILLIIIFFSLMTPLGIGLGALINHWAIAKNGEIMAASFNAFAAGTFLYISSLHHVHFHKHAKDARGMLEFVSLLLGVMTMGGIALWT